MGRKQMPSMDMPKHWVYRLSNAFTLPMQRHLWAAYNDLIAVAVPDVEPPASRTWQLTLGRRVFASDESGSSSQNSDAATRAVHVTAGTLQHRASSPAARAAALRFMATIDLLFGGAGEGRGRIEPGPFTPEERAPSPAPAWGGWGGSHGLFGSPRDMCARVDFSSLHTARIMQCVPGADGKHEIDPAEIEAAADAVRARCGVSPDTDIMPFRLGGLGTCVSIEIGTDDDWKLCEGYDEGYAFYLNLRPPGQRGSVDFQMPQLNMCVPLLGGDLLGFRSAVQLHAIVDNQDEECTKKSKKKKNKKKKKGLAAAAVEQADGDSDVEDVTDAMAGTSVQGGLSRASPSGSAAAMTGADVDAGPSAAAAQSYSAVGSSSAAGSSAAAGSSSAAVSSAAAGSSWPGSSPAATAGPSSGAAGPSSSRSIGGSGGGASSSPTAGSSSAAGPSSAAGLSAAVASSSARSGPRADPDWSAPSSSAIGVSSFNRAGWSLENWPPSYPKGPNAPPRVIITVWTDIETVKNVAMAAKLVWPELQIAGIESPPSSPELSPASGKRPAHLS